MLLELARRGRKCGIFLVIGAQSLKREDVGNTTIRQQFATKLLLRTGEAAQGRALGIDAAWSKRAAAFTERGLAVYAANDAAPSLLRVPYVSKAAAAHLLRGAEPPRPLLLSGVAGPETLETSRKASETAGNGFGGLLETPELPEIVLRLAAAQLSQNKIIESVWGVKPGGSDAYRLARDRYRAIVGDAGLDTAGAR
jgi:DNA segregation ATPase FtsK/SpoIIIE-like protein